MGEPLPITGCMPVCPNRGRGGRLPRLLPCEALYDVGAFAQLSGVAGAHAQAGFLHRHGLVAVLADHLDLCGMAAHGVMHDHRGLYSSASQRSPRFEIARNTIQKATPFSAYITGTVLDVDGSPQLGDDSRNHRLGLA